MATKNNKKTVARNLPFFLRVEDVTEIHKEKYVLYSMVEDEKIILPKSFTGINYQNFSKVDIINSYITIYNRLLTMEQSYAEQVVRNSVLQDRLVVNGLPVSMNLEEIKLYRVSLELALEQTLGNLKSKLPSDVAMLVEQKAIEEIRKTQLEQGMLLEFQIFEVSRMLKMNLEQQMDMINSFDEPSKKSASISKLQAVYLKTVELLKDLKVSAREVDEVYSSYEEKLKSSDEGEVVTTNLDDDDDDDFSEFLD